MNGKRPCPQPVRSHRPQQPQPMETNQSNPQNQHNQQHHHQQNQHQQHQHQQHQHQQNQHQQEPDPNSQHFDLIKYICEWCKLARPHTSARYAFTREGARMALGQPESSTSQRSKDAIATIRRRCASCRQRLTLCSDSLCARRSRFSHSGAVMAANEANADLDSALSSALGKPTRVESFEIVPRAGQRRGIMSDHYSLVASYECSASGETKSLGFFVKEPPAQEELRACLVDDSVSQEESYFQSVYPLLLEECTAVKWSPTCHHASPRKLVFEDVREQGYAVRADTMYDLASMRAALEALAAFHASSLGLETRLATRLERRYSDKVFLREKVFTREGKAGRGNELGFETLRLLAQTRFGLEDGSLVAKIHELVRDRIKPSPGLGRNVICHGDLWRGNIMFKDDDRASGQRPECLLVDFQMLRYGPPSLDLAMLLHVHSPRSFREAHEPDLLRHYYAKLSEYFRGELGFDYDELARDYESRRIVGMAYAAMRWPACVTSRLDDAEALRDWYFGARIEGYLAQIDTDPAFESLMRSCVEELIEHGQKLLNS
ncbi:unnamed protein product [Trichogramma brassicae]|uniref:CHK kinase-like domain-containing protein n=1 Tax=Trichogramma brassicae TaxID=86971 RepID=A0A6H5I118_9HYME|nr:unnamed protein product [Trichogramma brassicae]